jgi:cephalosporin hydroxylase
MFRRIHMQEGSSVTQEIVDRIKPYTVDKEKILVCLDSNHTHQHVLAELNYYSPFVSVGSYIVVFDTIVEDLPENYLPNRPWHVGNNPKTAVQEFLKDHKNFESDMTIDNKLLISVAPGGYLKRIK